MKFITRKGTKTFEGLTEIRQRIEECRDRAKAVALELGFEKYSAKRLSTGINGLYSPTNPGDGYKKLQWGWWLPKVRNKEACAKIAALPVLDYADLNKIVGFDGPQFTAAGGGIAVVNCPCIIWGDDFHLIEYEDGVTATPNSDMEELLTSEFLNYRAEIVAKAEAANTDGGDNAQGT